MSQSQNKKDKIVKSCLSVIKPIIFCGSNKTNDYEFISYDKSAESLPQQMAAAEEPNAINSNRQSNDSISINKSLISIADNYSTFDGLVHNETQLQSTHIDHLEIEPMIKLNKRALLSQKHSIKLTSTIIKEQTHMLIKNGYYASSTAIHDSFQTFDYFNDSTITSKSELSTFNTSESSQRSESFDSTNSTISFCSNDSYEQNCKTFSLPNEETQFYVCVSSYNAKLDGDISLRPNDQVKLIYNNQSKSNQFLLVQLISTGDGRVVDVQNRLGYAPKNCLSRI